MSLFLFLDLILINNLKNFLDFFITLVNFFLIIALLVFLNFLFLLVKDFSNLLNLNSLYLNLLSLFLLALDMKYHKIFDLRDLIKVDVFILEVLLNFDKNFLLIFFLFLNDLLKNLRLSEYFNLTGSKVVRVLVR